MEKQQNKKFSRFRFLKLNFLMGFKKIVLQIIRFYQYFISPSLGKNCRFYPSCSEYSYGAIKKHGIAKGFWLAIKRILRCHPFNDGGVDLP